ncbi:hypothetical protein Y032_0352g3260 [Ancylostoma ceylanicum]|uniref:Uncharacterized protein n=1 Tax=Ancylostoma ceylanicum TaxID=53326 RepID=A0A016RXA4_9BILA|nr:hypothetical protein Y032_0352g3260 [Ancylostoma ceylanicum]
MRYGTVLLKKTDGLRVRFLIVAAAESRRDLLALSLGACPLRIPRLGPAAMLQTRNPSIFLRRTVCQIILVHVTADSSQVPRAEFTALM